MKIEYLADYTEHIPTVAKWFHDEWGYLEPECDLEERTKRLREKSNRETIPVGFIAVDHNEPVGSAFLVECDMDTHSHLKPWLAGVYVQQPYRKHGIATALVTRVVDEAKQQGFSKLYLWTPKEENYYAKRGWHTIERTRYKNEDAVIMGYTFET